MILPGATHTPDSASITASFFKVSVVHQEDVGDAIADYASKRTYGRTGFVAAAPSREDAETIVVLEGWDSVHEIESVEVGAIFGNEEPSLTQPVEHLLERLYHERQRAWRNAGEAVSFSIRETEVAKLEKYLTRDGSPM